MELRCGHMKVIIIIIVMIIMMMIIIIMIITKVIISRSSSLLFPHHSAWRSGVLGDDPRIKETMRASQDFDGPIAKEEFILCISSNIGILEKVRVLEKVR